MAFINESHIELANIQFYLDELQGGKEHKTCSKGFTGSAF